MAGELSRRRHPDHIATPLREQITERSAAVIRSKYARAIPARHALAEGRRGIEGLAAGFHPAAIGARQASDGNHYLADPARPGKYLQVMW